MARGFLDKLAFEVEPTQKTKVTLTARLRYVDRHGRTFTVPKGFTCDLSSIPWWLKILPGVTSWSHSAPAGTFHDCGYRHFEVWHIKRKEMDLLYADALIDSSVKSWRAQTQRAGLRIGAWRAWRRWRATPKSKKGIAPKIYTL